MKKLYRAVELYNCKPFERHKKHYFTGNDIRETGVLFENVARYHKGLNTSQFVYDFMTSWTRDSLDFAVPRGLDMSGWEIFLQYVELDLGGDFQKLPKLKEGQEETPYMLLERNWIGECYIMLGYMLKIPSREIIKIFPWDAMREYFTVGHERDQYQAVEILIEDCKEFIDKKESIIWTPRRVKPIPLVKEEE